MRDFNLEMHKNTSSVSDGNWQRFCRSLAGLLIKRCRLGKDEKERVREVEE